MNRKRLSETDRRTIWNALYDIHNDGSRDTMMTVLIEIAAEHIGYDKLLELVNQQTPEPGESDTAATVQ